MLPKMSPFNPVYSSWLSCIHISILRMQPYFNPLNPTHQNEIKSEDQDVWQGIEKGARTTLSSTIPKLDKFLLKGVSNIFFPSATSSKLLRVVASLVQEHENAWCHMG